MASNESSQAKLYVILGSHACKTGMLMLEHKQVPYRTVRLPTGMQRLLPLLRFPHGTVPAVVVDGRRVQTNIAIARFLDEIQPEPPLLPREAAERARVEEAERWADEVFQMFARRLALAGSLHGPDGLVNRGADGRLGPLLWKHDRIRLAGSRMLSRFIFNVNPRVERDLLGELPAVLDRIDGWIAAGVLNGERLNAADLAIGSSLALLTYRPDVAREIDRRPAAALVDRVVPKPTSPWGD